MIQDGNGQNKASLRAILISSLASKRAGREVYDAIAEMQAAMNALLAKLDADAGVTDTDYEALLAVTPIED
jgi:hypothetical protein